MRLVKIILIGLCVLGAAVGTRLDAQSAGAKAATPAMDFTRISSQEIALLLRDVGETNPMLLKRLKEEPELRQSQIASLRELLAFASEAQKSGLADKQHNRNELENIRGEVTAVNYDNQLNKGKDPIPFGYINGAAVAAYWGEGAGSTLSPSLKSQRASKFEEFLETKLHIVRAGSPDTDKALTADERAQAREYYAKIRIYADEYAKRATLLPLSFRQKVNLHVKLQQAQFLARLYAEKLAADIAVSESEITNYLTEHPEFDIAGQRAKAEKILARAKSGEDFAKLANEFSEDPGNKNPATGELNGGQYVNVGKGVMVPPFEKAALALEAGQVSPELVETDYGFHIIKLESKSGDKYDVRHVLIATGVADPSNPDARTVPIREHIRKELENEKERKIIDRIVAANKISVPKDFVVPVVTVPGEAPKTTPKAKPRSARKRT